ncbi:MAG: hypothetical protein FWG53_06715 [Clostridiales bacterium]|nr:hypothetical protein [Clostridiales bacterium]
MKVYIVFLGIFLISISAISFADDMGKYMLIQRALDNVAEECAEFAAAEFAAVGFGGGEFRDGELAAQDFAEGLLRHTARGFGGVEVKDLSCKISQEVDFAEVRVSMDMEGLFRIFPSSSTRVVALSRCPVEEAEDGEDEDGEEGGGEDKGEDGEGGGEDYDED